MDEDEDAKSPSVNSAVQFKFNSPQCGSRYNDCSLEKLPISQPLWSASQAGASRSAPPLARRTSYLCHLPQSASSSTHATNSSLVNPAAEHPIVLSPSILHVQYVIPPSAVLESGGTQSFVAVPTQDSATISTPRKTNHLQSEQGSSNSTSRSQHGGGRKPIKYFHDHRPFKISTTDRKDKNIKYMTCVGKSPVLGVPCKATAKLNVATNEWTTTNTFHTCTQKVGREQVVDFEEYIKRLLLQDRESNIERCYRLASIKYPDAAKIFPLNDSMARKMRGWRGQGDTIKSEPIKNIEQFAEFLRKNPEALKYIIDFKENPKVCHLDFKEIVVGGARHLIMYDRDLVRRMRDAKKVNVDGTFDELPNLSDAKQLLVFMMQKYGKGFPVIYVIMSRRLTIDYQAVIQEIKKICPDLKPEKIITDYEKALRKALRLEFAAVILLACFFHFCQALLRQALKKKAAIRSNKVKQPERHLILRRFMALALLPWQEIQGALDYIIEDCHNDHGDYFDGFIDYFENEYMKIVTAKGFSVYGEDDKTNNKIESCNSYLLRLFGKTPPPAKFIRCLITVHQQQWIKLLTLESPDRVGRPVGCSTGKSGITREEFIKEKWEEYRAGDISVNDFVISCARFDDHVDIAYEENGLLPQGQEEMFDDEDVTVEAMYLKNGGIEELTKNLDDSLQHHYHVESSEPLQEICEETIQGSLNDLFEESENDVEIDVENSAGTISSALLQESSKVRFQQVEVEAKDDEEPERHQWAIVPMQHEEHLGVFSTRKRNKAQDISKPLKIRLKKIRPD